MDASIIDLRYNMKSVLKALDRNEVVNVLFHGKIKGTIIPKDTKKNLKVEDHPFFNMTKSDKPVNDIMDELRGSRY